MLNTSKLKVRFLPASVEDVTLENCRVGMLVRRGRVWNNTKWRDDIDKTYTDATVAKPRVSGRVIGFTNAQGILVGRNSTREYDTDRITAQHGPGWAVVTWHLVAPTTSVYPIGAEGVYSLVAA